MLRSWFRIRSTVLRIVRDVCLKKHVTRIDVTGHSLGAGLASLMTLDTMRLLQPHELGIKVNVFTYVRMEYTY